MTHTLIFPTLPSDYGILTALICPKFGKETEKVKKNFINLHKSESLDRLINHKKSLGFYLLSTAITELAINAISVTYFSCKFSLVLLHCAWMNGNCCDVDTLEEM